ncbi:MAG: ATP-binding protein [Spirochaetales bacterium]|nr:ATP-binding protein [Spirochaetales bacterium]
MDGSWSENDFSELTLFRYLLDERSECLWAVDRKFSLLFGNRMYRRFLSSHFPQKEQKDMDLTKIPDKKKAGLWQKAYNRVLTGVECQFDYVIGGGTSERIYTVKMGPIFHGKEIIGISSEGVEITDRIREEQEKTENQEKIRLMEKRQVVGQLAGDMARDFNNQLMGISGYVELLLKELPDTEKNSEYARHIMDGVDNSSRLVDRLQIYVRKDSHKPETLDMHRVLDELKEILRPVMEKKVKLDIAKGARYTKISGDRSSLQSSLINLIFNARDAIKGSGSISLRTRNCMIGEPGGLSPREDLKEGRYLSIAVIDQGCGMDEETRKRLFDPFTFSDTMGNTGGIGLMATYRTVKKHHGTILVHSSPGKGTCMELLLPCLEKPVEKLTVPQPETGDSRQG